MSSERRTRSHYNTSQEVRYTQVLMGVGWRRKCSNNECFKQSVITSNDKKSAFCQKCSSHSVDPDIQEQLMQKRKDQRVQRRCRNKIKKMVPKIEKIQKEIRMKVKEIWGDIV